jgi:uncharacterized membrane protein
METNQLNFWSRLILVAFFVVAGINHFVNPAFYYPLIPDYLTFPTVINVISGILEIILGFGLLWRKTRTYAAYLTIAMLVAFILSHIYFITIGACVGDGLCVPMWVAWLRLFLIHPLLIWWVWQARNINNLGAKPHRNEFD